MHIYIDESGQFVARGTGPAKAAVVGALVVPSHQRVALLRDYKKLRKALRPGAAEMKGSSITEEEAGRVIHLCTQYELLLVAVVIDLANISEAAVRQFQTAQADRLLEHITREHYPQMVHDVLHLSEAMRGLSPQLFLQAFATLQLVPEVLQFATLYYAQRTPLELASFEWTVDAKDKQVTVAERTWSTVLLPMMQTRSTKSPLLMLDTADYSAFERFTAPIPNEDGQPSMEPGTDLRRVIGEHLVFADSGRHLGLQLADNLVSLIGRTLNGKIATASTRDLGSMMPRFQGQCIRIIKPDLSAAAPESNDLTDAHWVQIVLEWTGRSRAMIRR